MHHTTQFHVGCSGFYNRHWKGIFYPEKLPQKEWLSFYSRQFNTLEINATFYQFPTVERMRTWHDKSPDDFLFSVKAPKTITHLKKFNDTRQVIDDFYAVCKDGLKDKLGCVLFQLPPGFHYSEENLENIIAQLNPDFKNVVEFRHAGWWNEKVYDELGKNKITFCTVNHPDLPTTIIANTSIFYMRLHGNPKIFYSGYSDTELKAIRQSILKKQGIAEVYVYFNNTAGIEGVLNAQAFQQMNLIDSPPPAKPTL